MLRKYMKPMLGRISLNAIIKMVGTMFEIVLPAILTFMIDRVVPSKDSQRIVFWGLIMVSCSIIAWILNITANRMASFTAASAIRNIRQDLFERIMNLSAKQIDTFGVSSLESRLTSDTYIIHRFLGASLRMGIRSIMLFIGGVLFCFILDWRLALVLVLLVPPLLLLIRLIFDRARPLFHQVQTRIDEMIQVIRENIRGIRVSKALDKTTHEQNRYATSNDNVAQAEVKAQDQMALMHPSVNIILYGGLTLVIIVGAYLSDRGLSTAGTVMAFMSYFIQITMSLMAMNRMFNIYNRSSASTERINQILNEDVDTNQFMESADTVSLPEQDSNVPEIEFKHVTFSYIGVENDLEDISFKIYPGETLGIMGATGSGKSTIARLLLRQYDVDSGEILIRGVNIKNLTAKDRKKLFGIVFQNDFLFSGSVRDNINFGRELAEESLMRATTHAQAAEFLESKEGGLDFPLASKGVNLSGGQKQRLLLSRALAGHPDILILDDSSSALDFQTDAKLRQALNTHFQESTSIIIAQRISSVKHANNILILDHGKMVDFGPHEELIERSELYQEIARMQMGAGVSRPYQARQLEKEA